MSAMPARIHRPHPPRPFPQLGRPLPSAAGSGAQASSAQRAKKLPETGAESSTRPQLRVVPGTPKRGVVVFALLCFTIFLGAMALVLGLNIVVSSAQYELAGLKNRQSELAASNQLLRQKEENLAAPSNVYQRAQNLGMTTGTSVGSINVQQGSISGQPTPAAPQDKLVSQMGAPFVLPEHADMPATPQPAAKSAESGKSTQDTAQGTDTQAKDAQGAQNSTEKPGSGTDTGKPNPQPAAQPAANLNGGTVPAPSQR